MEALANGLMDNSLYLMTRHHPVMVTSGVRRLRWAVLSDAVAHRFVEHGGPELVSQLLSQKAPPGMWRASAGLHLRQLLCAWICHITVPDMAL